MFMNYSASGDALRVLVCRRGVSGGSTVVYRPKFVINKNILLALTSMLKPLLTIL